MKIIAIILSILLSASASLSAQDMDDACIDSLARVFCALHDNDTAKLGVCLRIAKGHYNPDSTIAWSKRLISLAKVHHNATFEAKAYGFLSWAYYFKDEFLEANKCNYIAIIVADSIGDDAIKADNYRMLGDNYSFINDYQQSHIYYADALKLYEKLHDSTMIAACTRCMAQNFAGQKMYAQAESNYRSAIAIDSLMGETDYLLDDYTSLAWMFVTQYLNKGTKKDITLLYKAKRVIALADCVETDFLFSIYGLLEIKSHILAQEAVANGYKGDRLKHLLDTMRTCHEKGYEIVEKLNVSDKFIFDVCRSNYLTLCGKRNEAKLLLDSLLDITNRTLERSNYLEMLYTACDLYYTAIGDYKNAYYYKSLFYEHVNNETSINYAIKATQDIAQARFDEQISQHAEKEAQRKRRLKYGSIAVSLVLLFALFEIFKTRRHNRVLNNKNELLEKQKAEINSKNVQIMDSIGYASLIQRALMPYDAQMKKIFDDYYLIYRPLHIVAGDFYWMSTVGKYKIVVCADSTGHGVPGAFVSVLGINLLNDLAPLVLSNDGSPAKILDEMRSRLMKALGQDVEKFERGEKVNMDGIDLALAIIDTENNTLRYSGAYRPLWVFDGHEVVALKPNKMPIGIYVGVYQNFTEQMLPIKPGDVLYMFSDGITDQFGYVDESHTVYKHFSIKRLYQFVSEIASKPFDEQHTILDAYIDAWQNGYQQLDDIIFLAVKI